MKEKQIKKSGAKWTIFLFVLAAGALFAVNVQAFTVNVVDDLGNPVSGFRWLLEEDNTNVTVPGVPARVTISTDIHNSHAPVVAEGTEAGSSVNITQDANGSDLDESKRYFITVLPDAGHALGGTVVPVPHPTVTVTVNPLPLPTAQISLLAFVDHNPINNVLDAAEQGLGGATILLSDTGGQMSQDAFGNPLGTQYAFDPGTGEPILDGDGNPTVTQFGSGSITTLTQEQFDLGGPANPYNLKVGEALIKYLVPGKYGLKVVPPGFDDNGVAMAWSQTSTIEGTPTVDAWVKANEPKLFVEGFGTGFNHVFYGFVKLSPATSDFKGQTFTTLDWNQAPAAATGTISGTLRMNHFSRPPELQGFFPGVTVPGAWVGINDPLVQPGATADEAGKYIAPANEDGSFLIQNVPPGTYQLVTWDTNLDTLFGFHTVTVPPGVGGTGGDVVLGDVLTFRWFGTLNNYVFYDTDEDGFRDPGEPGIPEQNVNIRFRDGTIYQAFPTDLDGFVPFDEVFPFFKWLVVEVDFARFKATGMTTAVDYGGAIPGPAWPANGNKNPQPQDSADPANEYGTLDYRTETGPVLTQAMHLFLGQTNLIEWGKSHYADGENGGISGIVFYAVTRAENDPRYAAAEPWEPGVPRVQVNLYEDMVVNATGLPGSDGVIDDLDGELGVTLADVDNYPFQWAPMYSGEPGFTGIAGPEDVDLNYPGQTPGVFDVGDAIQITTTDSWDDNKPSGCIQETLPSIPGLGTINECADNFGTWNQVRPGLFDGGYAFDGLPNGSYIVEAITPPSYNLLKEEDRNVDFGDTYIPSTQLLPPTCVGDLRTVPDFMSFDGVTPAPFAGTDRPLCDRKQVTLGSGANAAADFFLLTQVPKAARAVGFVNNDLGAEFNQASPIYGEKLAAAWIPISFRDWKGKELVRVYADEFGGYNALLPSTYTVNVPSPTGVSPNMITLVLNDAFMADGVTPDPFYDPDYAITPWTFHYMPGATSYLDTPIVPVAAFAANDIRLDTGPANGTPVIYSVTAEGLPVVPGPNILQPGPLVCTDTTLVDGTGTITINATPGGTVQVRNPNYPVHSNEPTVTRDVGFGVTQGSGNVTIGGIALSPADIVSWSNLQIVANVPLGSTTGQIMVSRDNGLISEVGLTLNILDCSGLTVHTVASAPYPARPIQNAINAAAAGDIILVGAGPFTENVIMNKPVRLQGSGQGSFINGNAVPVDRLSLWHAEVEALGGDEFKDYTNADPFSAGEAPGIFVLGETTFPGGNIENPDTGITQYLNFGNPFSVSGQAAIDGFTISGSTSGGGVAVFSNAVGLEITNNNITGNQGSFAGGIVVGQPEIPFNWNNAGVVIRNNKIHRNGGTQGGGGIALNADSNGYLVEGNLIIGNFGRFNGGGIQHRGLSLGDNVIQNNRILFNEVFFGALLALAGDGAGIFIGTDALGLTGTGSVTINSNLIQGNMTGSGSGAGIRAFGVNGQDVVDSPADDTSWYRLNIFNNMIINNVAGLAGAGISLQDVARANIVNNTIARNDSIATSALAFQAGQANSTPQPSGIASSVHSGVLQGAFGQPEPSYTDPLLVNNIIWQNRSYFFDASLPGDDGTPNVGGLVLNPAGQYWELHVLGSVSTADPHLNPDYSILSSLTNPATGFDYTVGGIDTTNSQSSPVLLGAYYNTIESVTVVDEGGNAINIRFTPLPPLNPTQNDYHIGSGSAWDNGSNAVLASFPELLVDFDGESRPFNPGTGGISDIGADEIQAVAVVAPSIQIPGKKGAATDINSLGPRTRMSIGPSSGSSSSVPTGMITDQSGTLMDRVKGKLAGTLDKLVPGQRKSTGSGIDSTKDSTRSETPLNSTGSASEFSSGENQTLAMGLTPANNKNMSGLENRSGQENSSAKAFTNPILGEMSKSGYEMKRDVSMAKTDQSSAAGLTGVKQQQGESSSTIFKYSLVGLLLACLAFVFFMIIMPKTKNRREQ